MFDLTQLIKQNPGLLANPIIENGGQDVSHWFDEATGEPKMHIDPDLAIPVPFCPNGRYIHIPPREPDSTWRTDFTIAWWKDEQYLLGNLSRNNRKLRIINTLNHQENVLEVASEETFDAIRTRYLKINSHAMRYTWRWLCKDIDMGKTLAANGMPDESEEMIKLGLDPDDFMPVLHLYFNDDARDLALAGGSPNNS